MVHAAPRHILIRWGWLAFGLLACVSLVAAFIVRTGADACAASSGQPPTPGTTYRGRAVFYDQGGNNGNCSYGAAPADALYAGISPPEYAGGAACGGYLDVTGPGGSVRVKVIDQCLTCEQGRLDLSPTAFVRIAPLSAGDVPITYQAVRDPRLPGPLAFRVKPGSTPQWLALQVLDHGNPVQGVEVRGRAADWQVLSRGSDNYWVTTRRAGEGPYDIRLADTQGHHAIVTGLTPDPGQVQRSTAWMYGRSPQARAPVTLLSRGATRVTRC